MKRTITTMALALGLLKAGAQITVADFETFTLTANSAYSPTVNTPFQTANAIFDYQYGGYWSAGFAYTNIYDSVTAGYTNMYGVRAYNGYTNSSIYVVGQDRGKITLSAPQTTVNGFYITNTTYAYKSMAKGDAFAKKFGDTTGTGSGTTIPQGSYPDYFKVIVKGYKNGALKNDSVTAFLADFTYTNNAQDYILHTWQLVNTAIIGEVDSIKFFMRSSDAGVNGINTPLYFAIDNFTTQTPLANGIAQQTAANGNLSVYPNPFSNSLTIKLAEGSAMAKIRDLNGKIVYTGEFSGAESRLELEMLQSGVYFLEIQSGDQLNVAKIIKQ